jgi:hypothetical protein
MRRPKAPKTIDYANTPAQERRERAPALAAVDATFLEAARKALAAAQCGAIEFLAANPGLSKIELAQRLNHGVSAIGLIMAIYEEAAQKGVVREVAKDLLVRRIRERYPDGWSTAGTVRASVKLGRWYSELCEYARDPQVEVYASQIIRHIAIHHPPPDGWKPELQNDPVIDELFNRFWPAPTKG